jgi:hypothetical protein
MAHWRKAHQSASQFNSSAGLVVVGTAAFLGALVFIARHVFIFRLTSALPKNRATFAARRPRRQAGQTQREQPSCCIGGLIEVTVRPARGLIRKIYSIAVIACVGRHYVPAT